MVHGIELRSASAGDAQAIRALIRSAQINPVGLDWRRFTLAVDGSGRLVGCGQIKPHRDGSRELASIAVVPEWRGHGVARALIEHLLETHPGTLYLTCRASLGSLYASFGFQVVDESEMPTYFRWVSRAVRLMRRLGLVGEGLLVMGRQ